MRKINLVYLLLTLIILFNSTFVYAQQQFDGGNWTSKAGVELKLLDGQKNIYLTRGRLNFTGEAIQDGIVEFDMYTESERAFVYVYFREVSDQESEVVYIRTHKSNAPDTVQYAPVYQGRSAWQLYHGEKGTAPATLSANNWVPVKVEFRGELLRVWVGDLSEPVMEKVRLARPPVAGGITLRGNIPPASKAEYSAYIRNIKVTRLPTSKIESLNKQVSELTKIKKMNLSPVFVANKQPILELPTSLSDQPWSTVEAEQDGVFELLKWRTIPKGVRSWAAAATFTLDSTIDQNCTLLLGFSDAITLHLNNTPIAFADDSYRYSQNRQEGLLHSEQMQVFLPLAKGRNTITAVVADSFGGWGLQASLSDCGGVAINQNN